MSDAKTLEVPSSRTATRDALEPRWKVIVANDPVNLMSYVVLVFKKVFGYDDTRARRHMIEVHTQGRSVLWSGGREKAEHFVFLLQQWQLTSMIERDEAA